MDMNGFEHSADTWMTPGQSTSSLSRTHHTESSVPEGRSGLDEEVGSLRQEVCDLKAKVLHAVAVAMTAAIWFVVPVAGLSGMYYMTDSAIGPLCLSVLVALTGAMNYLLVNWMLIAWSEVDLGHPSVAVTDNLPHPPRLNALQPETEVQAQALRDKSPSRFNSSSVPL